MEITFFVAISPIFLILFLLLVRKLPLAFASFATASYTSVLALLYWQMFLSTFGSALLKGLFVGIDIVLIIAGALYFMQFFTKTKRLDLFKQILNVVHTDVRVQTIFFAMFFVAFIEGTAGFGTPAAVVVPLLVVLGIPAVYAVAIALIGDSVPVMFGAVSTPIYVGFSGIEFNSAGLAALLVIPLIVLMPLLMLWYVKKSGVKLPRHSKPYRNLIPFALWAAVCYIVPFVYFAHTSHELASLFGPLIGMAILGVTTYFDIFVPATVHEQARRPITFKSAFDAVLPYGFFIILLASGKVFALNYVLHLGNGLTHVLNFHNPGILFFIAIGLTILISHKKWPAKKSFVFVAKKLWYPFMAIVSLGFLVQLFIHSSQNAIGMVSMIEEMALILQNDALLWLSPFVGILGAFVSGSATVSNLLFANLQLSAAQLVGVSAALILSLQLVGGAIGNMIALTNIIAAQSTVGLRGAVSDILKLTIWPCLAFGLIVSIMAWLFF